jgi:hypothetical protein
MPDTVVVAGRCEAVGQDGSLEIKEAKRVLRAFAYPSKPNTESWRQRQKLQCRGSYCFSPRLCFGLRDSLPHATIKTLCVHHAETHLRPAPA